MLLKHGCSRSRKQNVSLCGEFLTVHREGGGSATLLVRDVGGSVSTTELKYQQASTKVAEFFLPVRNFMGKLAAECRKNLAIVFVWFFGKQYCCNLFVG